MEIFGFPAGPYKTNCFVCVDGGEATIIDPGMHTHDHLVEHFTAQGITPVQIVLTHGHLDHTRDAGSLAARYGIPVYIHSQDQFMLETTTWISPQTATLFDVESMVSVREVRHFDAEIKMGGEAFEVLHAPGHSPGSVVLVGQEVVFAGDVLFQGSFGRTDLPHSNPVDMDRTLREVISPLAPELQVLPGHGNLTTMRAEKAHNPFLKNLP